MEPEIKNPFEQGPYIQVAGFCDQVLEDKTGALSLIRIIDTLTHTEARPDAPAEMPPVTYRLKLVLMLKSGRARGRHEIKVVPELPSAETQPPLVMTVHLEGDERGQNVVADMNFTFTMEGLHWFKVFFDNALLTCMPFKVRYTRLQTTTLPLAR
ncbi:MAG: hypothetical protein HYY01_13080 [Chloroflexi bacterium]|nr:hypothetical protein [Chloroflexota bacterium]